MRRRAGARLIFFEERAPPAVLPSCDRQPAKAQLERECVVANALSRDCLSRLRAGMDSFSSAGGPSKIEFAGTGKAASPDQARQPSIDDDLGNL
jgi:hypothetical protein